MSLRARFFRRLKMQHHRGCALTPLHPRSATTFPQSRPHTNTSKAPTTCATRTLPDSLNGGQMHTKNEAAAETPTQTDVPKARGRVHNRSPMRARRRTCANNRNNTHHLGQSHLPRQANTTHEPHKRQNEVARKHAGPRTATDRTTQNTSPHHPTAVVIIRFLKAPVPDDNHYKGQPRKNPEWYEPKL